MEQYRDRKRLQAENQKIRWEKWQLQRVEAEQRAKEFAAYWERRHQEDKDLWRDKDFANAHDKMSRAGYKGKHGDFEIPEDKRIEQEALYMQITVGDYDGNSTIRCAEEWKKLRGVSRIDAQRSFIKNTNKLLTKYGWNPPPGWQ